MRSTKAALNRIKWSYASQPAQMFGGTRLQSLHRVSRAISCCTRLKSQRERNYKRRAKQPGEQCPSLLRKCLRQRKFIRLCIRKTFSRTPSLEELKESWTPAVMKPTVSPVAGRQLLRTK